MTFSKQERGSSLLLTHLGEQTRWSPALDDEITVIGPKQTLAIVSGEFGCIACPDVPRVLG